MKQTAIEWLQEKLDAYDFNNHHMEVNIVISLPKYIELLNQAKAMHKQEIIDTFGVGCQVESTRLIGYQDMAEQYYQESYGK